jgi:hypothetical protein
MNAITEAMLIDYLAGELEEGRRAEVSSALGKDPALYAEFLELEGLMNEIGGKVEAEPSVAADARFAAMIDGFQADAADNENEGLPLIITGHLPTPRYTKGTSGATAKVRSLAWKMVGIAAAIALIFTAGRFYEGGANTEAEQQLAVHRTLVMEMMELMKSDRTSNRIRAATVTFALPKTDPVTTANLGYLLRNDENVRLAALEALSRFSHDAGVRDELLAAMNESPPSVVRFELMETLVAMNEKRVIPYLEDLMNTDSLPQHVRDAAQMASFKLI